MDYRKSRIQDDYQQALVKWALRLARVKTRAWIETVYTGSSSTTGNVSLGLKPGRGLKQMQWQKAHGGVIVSLGLKPGRGLKHVEYLIHVKRARYTGAYRVPIA
ncbi:hypothetical protein THIX_60888 [Thiomonas sp. X19]|nr:hypothetical protein THIX_60888 [Thiomonas sp. X19]